VRNFPVVGGHRRWWRCGRVGGDRQAAAQTRRSKVQVEVKYVGFDIPNEFVVGYGLDYAEKYRNLRDVGTLAPHVYA
jgi:hypothetical protein